MEEVYYFLLEVFPRVTKKGAGVFGVSGDDGGDYLGYRALDYWNPDYDNYDLGVFKPFRDELEDMGYYVEWQNPGTAHITPL